MKVTGTLAEITSFLKSYRGTPITVEVTDQEVVPAARTVAVPKATKSTKTASSKDLCSIAGCQNERSVKGLCPTHYIARRKYIAANRLEVGDWPDDAPAGSIVNKVVPLPRGRQPQATKASPTAKSLKVAEEALAKQAASLDAATKRKARKVAQA